MTAGRASGPRSRGGTDGRWRSRDCETARMAGAAPASTNDVGAGRPARLSRRGRAVRGAVTVAGGLALLAGTLWGSNDHFPFGPFTMYATARRTDGYVRQTRVEAVDATGHRATIGDAQTGLRRAEIEGQIPGFREDPERLAALAEAHAIRRPDAPPLVRIDVVQWRYQLEDGKPSGDVTKQLVVSWTDGGGE